MTLHAHEALTLYDALQIMHIRNRCKDGFSTYTERLDGEAQERWWNATEGARLAWLYRSDDGAPYVGFGVLLLQDDGCWTTTVAVLPEYAGNDYGKAIIGDIVTRSPGRCRSTARKDNPAAVKLHVPYLWDVVDGPDERLVYFETKRGVTAV